MVVLGDAMEGLVVGRGVRAGRKTMKTVHSAVVGPIGVVALGGTAPQCCARGCDGRRLRGRHAGRRGRSQSGGLKNWKIK